ncbi:MAG: GreA/GreB family elongation factor [Elusimicrobia bacterium]|nr:GreA/GreB family elongation factor [Elusimicrobiota bacterium]
MSRAFIKEDAGDPDDLPERHQSTAPNYVTQEGLAALMRKAEALRSELDAADRESRRARELKRDLRYYEGRLGSAVPVDPKAVPTDEARFGAAVDLQGADGSVRTVSIVGQDEAEEGGGKLAWDSSLALALLGKRPGDRVEVEDWGASIVKAVRYPGR